MFAVAEHISIDHLCHLIFPWHQLSVDSLTKGQQKRLPPILFCIEANIQILSINQLLYSSSASKLAFIKSSSDCPSFFKTRLEAFLGAFAIYRLAAAEKLGADEK